MMLLFTGAGADPGFDQGGAPDRDRPKTAILGPQFCRILVLGPHFWWSGGGARGPPLDPPLWCIVGTIMDKSIKGHMTRVDRL